MLAQGGFNKDPNISKDNPGEYTLGPVTADHLCTTNLVYLWIICGCFGTRGVVLMPYSGPDIFRPNALPPVNEFLGVPIWTVCTSSVCGRETVVVFLR